MPPPRSFRGAMQRDDLQGDIRAPHSLQDHITRRGGKNPFGEPMYRLVWGESRVVKQGGRWQDWDKNLSIQERGGVQFQRQGNGILVPYQNKPLRIVEEVRLIRKYGFEGWVLERWCPSIMYPRALYEQKIPGTDVPLIGPYPENGEYEMVAGGAGQTTLPELSWIDSAISQCEALRHRHRNSVEQEVLLRVNAAQQAYEAQMQQEEENIRLRLRKDRAILFGTSLAAGRIRNELARRAGITEHVGN